MPFTSASLRGSTVAYSLLDLVNVKISLDKYLNHITFHFSLQGIEIKNFSGSWSNGLAFCALIHKFNPDKFDFNELDPNDREGNFRTAFDTAL